MNVRDSFLATESAKGEVPDALGRTRAMLDAVTRAQGAFLTGADARSVFDQLLAEVLAIGESEYGFIGDVLYDDRQQPYLKTYALTNIAWDETTRRFFDAHAPAGLEFRNLDTLFGAALTTRRPVISNDPARDPRAGGTPPGHPPLRAFVGVPFQHGGRLVGMVGLANRVGGYSDEWLAAMAPLLETVRTLIVAHRARREREAMQAQLARAAEETRQLALVASLTSNLVVITDAERRVEWVNAAFERVTGHTLAEVRGRRPGEFLHGAETDDAAVDAVRERLARGEGVRGLEVRNYAKDGRQFWALLDIQPVRDDRGAIVQYVAVESDISELRAARERAETAERELREAIEALEDGFVLFDADDRLVICNAHYREIYRESADLIRPGMRFEGGLREGVRRGQYPEALGREEEWIAARLAAHRSANAVIEQQLPDGRWIRIAERRTADGGIVGFRVDITELKQATERAEAAARELRLQQSKYAAAFRNSSDHIVLSRLADGVIVEVNDAFCRATGNPRETVLGRTTLELGAWAEPAERERAKRLVIANGTLSNFAFRQRRHDGSVMHCLLSASVIDIDGERYVLSAARDISERVAAEEASKLLNKRLQATVAALEELNRRNAQLGEMRDLLHTCQTPDEVYKIAAHFVPLLVPDSAGALYLLDESRVGLEAAFAWGAGDLGAQVFAPDACWSLRRGRTYRVHDAHQHLVCAHVHERPRGGYLCLPIAAQGEARGVMHVRFDGFPDDDPLANEAQEEFVRTMTEHVALALANARLRENLRIQASRDALTGLVNRRYMEETFEREIRRCARRDKPIAVMMVDVDHFKRFNDTHGHEAGDSVLRRVAATLAESVRYEDIVCRYGGEEFLLVLPEADEAAALERAEHARAQVAQTIAYFREQTLGSVSVSIGVAMFPADGSRPDQLIRAADAALYRAKGGGRNRVVLHRAAAPQ